jgi:hypothetical protein
LKPLITRTPADTTNPVLHLAVTILDQMAGKRNPFSSFQPSMKKHRNGIGQVFEWMLLFWDIVSDSTAEPTP